jgi:hypothetical protein
MTLTKTLARREYWKTRVPMGERSLRILDMCAEPEGATSERVAEAVGIRKKIASALLGHLTEAGRLHRGKVPSVLVHYFTSAAAAQAWTMQQTSAKWRLDLPGAAHSAATGHVLPALKTEVVGGVRVTRGPSIGYDPRYCLDPDTRVVGGFATLGIGRYTT